MTHLELWHLVLLLLAFFGACGAFGKLLLSQLQRHMDDRFELLEAARAEQHLQLSRRLESLGDARKQDAEQWRTIERELMVLQRELPLNYVRREDYVQAVATIMAKLDGMALRFENILLRGENRDR